MHRIKNLLFLLFLVLSLFGGIWAYLKLKEIKQPSVDALDRLPDNCSVYLRTDDLLELNKRLNTRSLIIDLFSELPPLSEFLKPMEWLCEKAGEHPVLEETFSSNRLHFAYYPQKNYWLISFNLNELGQERLFQTTFSETFFTKKIDTDHYSFELNSKETLFIGFHKGGVCVSNSLAAIDDALNPEITRLKLDSAFALCSSEFEDEKLLSIYIAHQKAGNAKSNIHFNALQTSGYTSGEIEVQPSELVVKGSLYPDKNELLKALLEQKPQEIEPAPLLPASCIAFTCYGFQDYSALVKHHKASKASSTFWSTLQDTVLFDLRSTFYKNLTSSVCEFEVSGYSAPFVFSLVQDTSITHEQLIFMSDSILESPHKKIYRIKASSDPLCFLEPLSNVECRYAFVHDNTLYFSENSESAFYLAQCLVSGTTLDKNEERRIYAQEQFPEEFNLLIYGTPAAQPENIFALYPSAKSIDKKTFQGLKNSCLSLIALDNRFKLRWQCAIENEAEEGGEKLLWTIQLDTTCSMNPHEFVNHISSEKELLVQDDANTLYLINSKGRILWKKRIREKIRSRIYKVDMFRNNKYQLLFSSDNYLHLIDRNGNYLETYPLKTPSKISSALCVFDYDGTRDYRLFFACANKKIYNYTIYGIRNERFHLVKTDAEVTLPIQYVKVGPSDFLIVIDVEGKIYGFSRRGEMRLQLSNRTLLPCKNIYLDASKNLQTTKLIYLDEKAGTLHKISLADKKELIPLKNEGLVLCSSFNLVDENRNMDLIFAESDALYAYNLNGNRLFEIQVPLELTEIDFYADPNLSVYYGWSQNNKELYLFENRTNESRSIQASAMPLFSNLFKDNKIFLIFPDNDRLNCLAY